MISVWVMQMTIVKIIDVVSMLNSSVPTIRAVNVGVLRVMLALCF